MVISVESLHLHNFDTLSSAVQNSTLASYALLHAFKFPIQLIQFCFDMESDRISCLPDNIIDQILSRLPIKDAGRTSVLSSEWRKKWSTQSNLVFQFDRQCLPAASSEESEVPSVIKTKFIRTIDDVLLLHSGPINKVKISDSGYDLIDMNSVADIDRWILHLTTRSIKNLVLNFWIGQYYKIPLCLFSCQNLHRLQLHMCWLKPPTEFEGFMNLKSLHLEQVTMTQDAFEKLISGSPLLEKLKMAYFDGFTQINIHAPNIKCVQIIGKFEGISFDNTPQLTRLLVEQTSQSKLHGCSSNVVNFFDHLPNIQKLVIVSYFIKYLFPDAVPVKLPTPCINLTDLHICINFNDLKKISAVLCLLNSSANLNAFGIYARPEEHAELLTHVSYCWEDIFSEPVIPLKLRHVKIRDISGTKSELDFIRFLLLYSPMLEKMIVKPAVNVKPELVIELLRFRRASTRAEIIYHRNDSS